MRNDDNELIERCRSGDADAFGMLYDANVRRIYDFIYYRTHHRETAEDLAADVFLKAFAKIGDFDPKKGTFTAWIYRIARNRVIDHYRSAKGAEDIEDVWDLLASGDDPARDADARERLAEVERHMAVLPAAQREVVILRVWDGLSYAEIAETTGKSEAACKMSFSRAVSALRKNAPLAAMLILLINPLR
ncbi:MAG TPA: RNA polymerase sigma factor [Candidatus Eisenbacteria bacterium]|jgi:RNA polymerase sigma-70 factor (ECF subfamily)|nr:RNA polymerase sigma factor [Candidatus Eisenbacteria bacterium]